MVAPITEKAKPTLELKSYRGKQSLNHTVSVEFTELKTEASLTKALIGEVCHLFHAKICTISA